MLCFFISLLENNNGREKLTEIYHQYQRRMYAVAMHYLHNAALAEDAVQDSFVKIIKNFLNANCKCKLDTRTVKMGSS